MKIRIIASVFFCCVAYTVAKTQGMGIGYNFNLGWQNYIETGDDYSQQRYMMMHEAYVRYHNITGQNSVQIGVGIRKDNISFSNFSQFLDHDGITIDRYYNEGTIDRFAWRFSLSDNLQFGGKPGGLLLALSGGMYLEYTFEMVRNDLEGDYEYTLNDEIYPFNPGIMLGIETRMKWLTFGYRFEKPFMDMLDHDYINSLRLRTDNSTELRGLRLGASTSVFYIGISLDFFSE